MAISVGGRIQKIFKGNTAAMPGYIWIYVLHNASYYVLCIVNIHMQSVPELEAHPSYTF